MFHTPGAQDDVSLMVDDSRGSVNRKTPVSPSVASKLQRFRQKCRLRNNTIREMLAEFLGTMMIIIFGCGTSVQCTLSSPIPEGAWTGENFAWGFGVAFGVFISMGVSGGHINPAITIAMVCHRRLKPWWKVFTYIFAQTLGAFVGAAIVYGIYNNVITKFDPNKTELSAHTFATFPPEIISNVTGFFDQVLGTALLVGLIFAMIDPLNQPATQTKGLFPICLGFLIFAIASSYGYNAACALNPARDLGPRIFLTLVGYNHDGFNVWTAHGYWFWIPIVAPIVGGLVGTFTYTLLVEWHHPIPDPVEAAEGGDIDGEDA